MTMMMMTMTMIRKSQCRNPNPAFDPRSGAPGARSSTPTASPTTRRRVIDLLMRVTRVSVETMKIVDAMRMEKMSQPKAVDRGEPS
jgi:hypothetical protein